MITCIPGSPQSAMISRCQSDEFVRKRISGGETAHIVLVLTLTFFPNLGPESYLFPLFLFSM
jgi:hypothetical protein